MRTITIKPAYPAKTLVRVTDQFNCLLQCFKTTEIEPIRIYLPNTYTGVVKVWLEPPDCYPISLFFADTDHTMTIKPRKDQYKIGQRIFQSN